MGEQSRNANELIRIGERARLLEGRDSHSLLDINFKNTPILLFGVGQLGAMTIAHMRRIGLEPVGLVDNNMDRWGAVVDGISVVSPQDAIRDYGSTGRFIVTIYNGSYVRHQLLAAGCTYVSHFADLYFQHCNEFLPFGGLTIRSTILNAWPDVVAAADLWHDEDSRIEYNSQVAWRLRLPESELPRHDPPEHCYFPPDLFAFEKNEFLLDCGAFDGDSLQRYFSVTPAQHTFKDRGLRARSAFLLTLDQICRNVKGERRG